MQPIYQIKVRFKSKMCFVIGRSHFCLNLLTFPFTHPHVLWCEFSWCAVIQIITYAILHAKWYQYWIILRVWASKRVMNTLKSLWSNAISCFTGCYFGILSHTYAETLSSRMVTITEIWARSSCLHRTFISFEEN